MAFKLTVRCHGIMTRVEAPEGDQVALLLPKAERTVVTNQVAYVKFPLAAHKGPRELAGRRGGDAHVELVNERLTIVAQVAPHHQRLTLRKGRDRRPSATPTRNDERSLDWLPSLAELVGDTGRNGDSTPGELKDEFFISPRTSTPPLLARVDFMQGVLGTTGTDPVQVVFMTRDRTKPMRRPVARELLLELDVEGDSFSLQSQRWDGTVDAAKEMTFTPNGDLEIVIGNESEDDIYIPTAPTLPIDVLSDRCMAEFELYFRMCRIEPREPLLPFLSARPGVGTCCSICDGHSRLVKQFPSLESVRLKTALPVDSEKATSESATPAWTALTFLAADNSLSRAADADLDELEKVDSEQVGVVVQIDRPDADAEFLVLEPGGFASTSLGNVNFGDPKTLTEFLRAGKAARPAKHMVVCFPTHGAGLLDFSFDRYPRRPPNPPWRILLEEFSNVRSTRERRPEILELNEALAPRVISTTEELGLDPSSTARVLSLGPDNSSLDFIDNEDLARGLRDAIDPNEEPFAVLGFDACVMGLVEMAYQVRESGRYFVASQDDVSVEGWRYAEILSRFTASTTPKDAAQIIVEVYGTATAGNELATLSAVDLRAVSAVAVALNDLGDLLEPLVEAQLDALAQARGDARAFSTFHYIDLHEFVRALQTRLGQSMAEEPKLKAIRAAADVVLKQIDAAVIATSRDPAQSRAHGLSVYVPNSPVVEEYRRLSMSTDSATKRWYDFVVKYAALR